MIPQQEEIFVRALYKGFREYGLIPNRDTQGYQKVQHPLLHYKILLASYIYGAVPDYDLDEMNRVKDPRMKIRLLFEAYRHGMKFDYDKHQLHTLDDIHYSTLLTWLYNERLILPCYTRSNLDEDDIEIVSDIRAKYQID
jgi:hypothetical protein